MDFSFSEDQRLLRDALAKLAEKYDRAYWPSKAGRRESPEEMWRALGDAGYLGLLIPEEYGGAGLGMLDMQLLIETLCEHGTPLLFLVVSSVMGTLAIARHGSEEQKRRFLPRLAKGEI